MALDAYSPCPCGSGKKFKWCCQPIHVQLDKAFRLDRDGQHEAALRIMDEVLQEHPANPEAWGRKAQMLYENDRPDEAENALQKALDINPNYPYGHLLRGLFRQQEGEVPGALLLFRKAAELYDPEAKPILAQVYTLIFECEMKLNRPVAGRAALKIALHCRPNDELRQGFDQLFGDGSHLPPAARRDYVFLSPHAKTHASRLAAWERALAGASTGKLIDVHRAFEQLTQESPEDPAAWYNLGLTRAWLGENARALEALDRYVSLEPDEGRAGAAWALGEVLRFGYGMEDQADYVEHSALFQIRSMPGLMDFLQKWEQERRLANVQVRREEGILTGMVLDPGTGLLAAGTQPQPARLAAYLLITAGLLRLWHTTQDSLEKVRQDLLQRTGNAVMEAERRRGPAAFHDVFTEAVMVLPQAVGEEELAKAVRDQFQRYFEETWIHRPLHSLGRVPPIDAAGHATLRKKLLGVVQFLQDCLRGDKAAYDFDRLRRKLGLLAGQPEPAAGAKPSSLDVSAMGAAELAGVTVDSLSDEDLERAYQAAQKLDAPDLAGRFVRTLVARPPRPDRPDRYPWYSHLVQLALAQNNIEEALKCLDQGLKADSEQNEGRRRNDYELRRGQVLAKRGDAAAASDVFERLIERAPANLRYRGSAAEAMLSLKEGGRALRFAEQGLVKSREQNDRDSEQYFLELVSAAKRQGG